MINIKSRHQSSSSQALSAWPLERRRGRNVRHINQGYSWRNCERYCLVDRFVTAFSNMSDVQAASGVHESTAIAYQARMNGGLWSGFGVASDRWIRFFQVCFLVVVGCCSHSAV